MFADNLKTLPLVDHIQSLSLFNTEGKNVGSIENKPGQSGSLRLYYFLSQKYQGNITIEAAQEGLNLYAEHTADAQKNPGKHPNIDRLLSLIEAKEVLRVAPLSNA
ncbi:MAG: DUF2322 family protein [Pseudomonadota bacterium]